MAHTRRPVSVCPIHLISRLNGQDRLIIANPDPIVGVDPVEEVGDDLLERRDHGPVREPIHPPLCLRVVAHIVSVPYQLWRKKKRIKRCFVEEKWHSVWKVAVLLTSLKFPTQSVSGDP